MIHQSINDYIVRQVMQNLRYLEGSESGYPGTSAKMIDPRISKIAQEIHQETKHNSPENPSEDIRHRILRKYEQVRYIPSSRY